MDDTYVFDDNDHHYDQLAWYTPTKVGYNLESHGWIRQFKDEAVIGPVTIEASW
jgi:hypothetical protein